MGYEKGLLLHVTAQFTPPLRDEPFVEYTAEQIEQIGIDSDTPRKTEAERQADAQFEYLMETGNFPF